VGVVVLYWAVPAIMDRSTKKVKTTDVDEFKFNFSDLLSNLQSASSNLKFT